MLNGQCKIEEVVYKGTLSSNQTDYQKNYFGAAEESSKRRLYNYNLSFRNEFYKNNTELSEELWQIKMKNYTPQITCLPHNYNTTNFMFQ